MSTFNINKITANTVVNGDNTTIIAQLSDKQNAESTPEEKKILYSIFQNTKSDEEVRQIKELVDIIFQHTKTSEERQEIIDNLRAIQSEDIEVSKKNAALKKLQGFIKSIGEFAFHVAAHVTAIHLAHGG